MPQHTLILIGYRGCGKTSVGKGLAKRWQRPFVDVDDRICERFGGLSIREIWQQHGEPAFREMEVEVTRDLCDQGGAVIGLGGGTLMQGGARQAVENAPNTLRVYLHAHPVILFQRIEADPQSSATRPNLTRLGGGVHEIEQMLAERQPVYRAVADLELDVSDIGVDEVVERLASR